VLQEIHDDIKRNSYIDNEEIKPSVLIHPKYRTVTWILIINMFIVGMNGNFAYTAAYKFAQENSTYLVAYGTFGFAGLLELLKLGGVGRASTMLKNGRKNRKRALQTYACSMTFLNLLLLSVALMPLFSIKEAKGIWLAFIFVGILV
jgi:hypothetical protein